MMHTASFAFLITISFVINTALAQSAKPDFNGTWKLVKVSEEELNAQLPYEVYTFEQTGNDFRAVMRIKDGLGERTFDVKVKMDGKPHEQRCGNVPCTITASWDDSSLVWSLQREIDTGNGRYTMLTERKMQLSADRKTITSQRSLRTGEGQRKWVETWERI